MNLLQQNSYTFGLWMSERHKSYVILYDIMGNHDGNCEHPISITISMKQYLNSYKNILLFFGKLNHERFGYDFFFYNLSNPVVHNLSFLGDNRTFLCPCMLLLVWVWVPGHPLHHPSWTDGASGSLLQVYGWLSNLGSSICEMVTVGQIAWMEQWTHVRVERWFGRQTDEQTQRRTDRRT